MDAGDAEQQREQEAYAKDRCDQLLRLVKIALGKQIDPEILGLLALFVAHKGPSYKAMKPAFLGEFNSVYTSGDNLSHFAKLSTLRALCECAKVTPSLRFVCEVSICPCIKCYDSNASFQSRIPVHKTQLTRMGGMDGT